MYRVNVRALWMALALTLTIACVFQLATLSTASAQNLSNAPIVFDVRRNLPLEPGEEVYRDFYISAGSESGFKKGMIIPVVRQISVHNPIINKQQANLSIPVGRLLVMHVERGISVAREESELTDEDRPTLEFEGIMIGDKVDLAGATQQAPDATKKKNARPSKVSAAPMAAPAPVAAFEMAQSQDSSARVNGSAGTENPSLLEAQATRAASSAATAAKAPVFAPSSAGSPSSNGASGSAQSPMIAVPVPAPRPAANPPSAAIEKAFPSLQEPDIVRDVHEEGRGRVGESSRSRQWDGQSLLSDEGDGPRASARG